jgi:hypothetical protein
MMSLRSRPPSGSAFPNKLRWKQSLIRSSITLTLSCRERYWGNRLYTPTQGAEWGRVPASRWQLVHRSRLPTYCGRLSDVAVRMARPRRMAAPNGPLGISLSAGTCRLGRTATGAGTVALTARSADAGARARQEARVTATTARRRLERGARIGETDRSHGVYGSRPAWATPDGRP